KRSLDAPPFQPHRRLGVGRDRVPAPSLLCMPPLVELSLQMRELALELDVALPALVRQRARCERGADRTPGLDAVRAVGEAALEREARDVVESLLEPVARFPELELPQARRIDHDPALREHDQLAVRRRMPAAAVRAQVVRRE